MTGEEYLVARVTKLEEENDKLSKTVNDLGSNNANLSRILYKAFANVKTKDNKVMYDEIVLFSKEENLQGYEDVVQILKILKGGK